MPGPLTNQTADETPHSPRSRGADGAADGPAGRPPLRNTFQETLLGLEYTPRPEGADLFSRACVEQYQEYRPDRFGYVFAQVFEPNTLTEVALLEGVSPEAAADLSHRPTASMTALAEHVEGRADLPVVTLVNLAAALISVSRFDAARLVLADAEARARTPEEVFETAMLAFVVANRRDDGAGSPPAFARMRQAVETGRLVPHRALDACAQAVVWYLKRQELPEADYRWFLNTGLELVRDHPDMPSGGVSSWYRALAMLPAAEGDAAATRRYMESAREAADETYTRSPRAYELHLLKTYYESSVKEHMYVTRDLDRAVEAGRALIALDPVWSPSYGELGDVMARFGKPEAAARLYEKAVSLGAPYYGHHLLRAARMREKATQSEQALGHYEALARLAPDSAPLLEDGLRLARSVGHGSRAYFEDALARLREQPSPAAPGESGR
ncbi:tetratricopeptide repeat protein [Streptomyces sp. NPDC060184]|uniref:tetratricopeptide repeat protein n=1 Tax=Streptomyces sp. NPDC060184 TaxID=3347064 RepID=UPI0036688A17